MAAERCGELSSAQRGSGVAQDGGDVYVLMRVNAAEYSTVSFARTNPSCATAARTPASCCTRGSCSRPPPRAPDPPGPTKGSPARWRPAPPRCRASGGACARRRAGGGADAQKAGQSQEAGTGRPGPRGAPGGALLLGAARGPSKLDLAPFGRPHGRVRARRGGGLPRDRLAHAQKNGLRPHLVKEWVIPPRESAAFVWRIREEILDLYEEPYDERARELLGDGRPSAVGS